MFNNLTKNIDQSKLAGIRIGTVGLLLALVGTVLIFMSAKLLGGIKIVVLLGSLLLLLGAPIVFIGMGVHFYIMFKTFVKRE